MTRITVSLPADVSAYLADKPNASAEVALAVRQRMRGESVASGLREVLEAAGFTISEDRLAYYREQLRAAGAAQDALTDVQRAAHAAEVARWRELHPGTARLAAA